MPPQSTQMLCSTSQGCVRIQLIELRIIETWGPFPIQPVVIRRGIPIPLKASIHRALLQAHLVSGERFRALGFVNFVEAERIAYDA